MDVHFTGVLRDPLSNPVPNHDIRITALHTDETMRGSTVTFKTDGSGAYDFYLLKGFYKLEVLNVPEDEYLLVGNLYLNQSTPQGITLEEALLYSERVEPNELIALDEPWLTWWNGLVSSSLSTHREHRDEINNTHAKTLDLQETWVSDDCAKHGSKRTTVVQTKDSRVQHEEEAYYDETEFREFAVSSDSIEADGAGIINDRQVGGTVSDIATKGTDDSLMVQTDTLDTTVTSKKEMYTGNGVFVKLKELALAVKETLVLNYGSNALNKKSIVDDTIEESYDTLVGSKASSVTHTNDGSTTRHEIIVDQHFIGKTPLSPTMYVDTVNGKVTVYGQLQVSQLLDENGDPVDLNPSDGDTIYQVYQYSESNLGPWKDTVSSTDIWRRENWNINGTVDPLTWSAPYQFRGFNGSDGNPGDTIYIEYQYSPDGITWHSEPLLSGDKWRRERVVTNGVAGPWSDAGRIVGDDGETIETRSEYSIDGIYNWHSVPDPADKWERRAVFVNGVQQGPWSDPIPFGDGDTIFEEFRYGPTETIDGNWTAWGGTQLDTHFWRQARTVTNGVPGPGGVVHRIVGKPGSGWYTIVNTTGTWPGDAQATVDFINNFGRSPTLDDHLTYTNNANATLVTSSEVKRCNSPEGSPVTWSTPAMVIQGDLIARGTISGDRLVANTITGNQISSATTIIAGSGSWTSGMNGNDLASAGVYRYWRFWAGATDPSLAPFRVYRNGDIYVGNGIFNGSITASSLTLSGANTQIQSSNYASGLTGWAISNNGSAEFNEVIVRGTGYFTDGVFDGTVYAEHISGDIVSARVKPNPALLAGFTLANEYRDIMDMVTVSTVRPYERHLQLGVTDGFNAFRLNTLATSTFANMTFTMELVHEDDTIFWTYTVPWDASVDRLLQVTLPMINATIPANTPAGTYRLRVKSNYNMDWVRYMQYSAGSAWLDYDTKLLGYLFKNSNDLL